MHGHLNFKNKRSCYNHCPFQVGGLEVSVPLIILKAPSVILVINLNVQVVPL